MPKTDWLKEVLGPAEVAKIEGERVVAELHGIVFDELQRSSGENATRDRANIKA